MTTLAIYQLPNGQTRTITEAEYRKQQGRSKGGYAIQASGQAYRFTSETAAAAGRTSARRRWKRKRLSPFKGREGIRIGLKKPRPPLDYAALRQHYAAHPTNRIRYDPKRQQWRRACPCWTLSRVLSERQALRYLGHLPWPTKRTAVGCRLVKILQPPRSTLRTMSPEGDSIITWPSRSRSRLPNDAR